jgi:hypothetical protein
MEYIGSIYIIIDGNVLIFNMEEEIKREDINI